MYYKNNAIEAYNSTSTNRVKYNNDSAKHWWLRSPHYSDSGSFCFVTDKGVNSNVGNYSYNTYGVAPGFCI